MIIDLKVVLRELLGPTDLARAQTLHIHKLKEVIVVSEDKNLVFATFQIVMPILKNLNDG